jgi:hypothetical protein
MGTNMKKKRKKRLSRLHESQPLTMWRDDKAAIAFIYAGDLEGSATVIHNTYGMVFCVANNWEPT